MAYYIAHIFFCDWPNVFGFFFIGDFLVIFVLKNVSDVSLFDESTTFVNGVTGIVCFGIYFIWYCNFTSIKKMLQTVCLGGSGATIEEHVHHVNQLYRNPLTIIIYRQSEQYLILIWFEDSNKNCNTKINIYWAKI